MIDVKRVTKYCCEDISSIEGYEEAVCSNKKEYVCHHRLETHNSDGERRLVDISMYELKALDMYYNRPAYELVFMSNSEHTQLHHKGKRKGQMSEEHKRKIVETRRKNGSYGMSDENKEKLRNANIGKRLSEDHKRKISEAHKGKPSPRKGKHWKLLDGKRVWY